MATKKKKKDKKDKAKKGNGLNLMDSIQSVHSLYEKKLDQTFSKFDLSNEQFRILQILNEAPEEGFTLKQIRETLPNQTSNATRLVEKLNAKKLLSKKSSKLDKRSLKITLTPSGNEALAMAQEQITSVENQIKNTLSAKHEKSLNTVFSEVTKILNQESQPDQ